MEPLSVDVNCCPSSSAFAQSPLPRKSGPDSYEVVSYSEVQIPEFRHVKRLGRGSYGTVVECFFRGRPAAAKLVENGDNEHSHIRMEAELLHGFRHKNIIKLYALFHGEMSGLVLELMEGRSLSELLHQNKHITYQACHLLSWALQVCEALSYLHAHNYIHRDIKPSNMLLSRDYKTLKLCDFGTVAELKTSMTENRGTAAWMAPEVFRGRRYDQKCDIFSFGISLWEMITRQQPFTNLNETNPVTLLWKVAENGLRPPRIEDLPKPLMDMIERCWHNNPEERPFLEEVQKTIEAFIEIFPNANLLPLVDRTTARQALAESPNVWPPTYRPIPPASSGYQPPPTITVQRVSPSGGGIASPVQTQIFIQQVPQQHHQQPHQQQRRGSSHHQDRYLQLPDGQQFSHLNSNNSSSHSMMDISTLVSNQTNPHSTHYQPNNGVSSNNYSPCLSPPMLQPVSNFGTFLAQPPQPILRTHSLPPPMSAAAMESSPERNPSERQKKKKRLFPFMRGFTRF